MTLQQVDILKENGKSKELNLLLDKQLRSVGRKEKNTVIRDGNVRIGNFITSYLLISLNSMFQFYPTFRFHLDATVFISLMPLGHYWVVFLSTV